jgi:hypothetical protein
VIIATTRATGRVSFRPLPSVSRRHSVIVDVYERGMLRTIVHLASFTGPVITTPGRPTHLALKRRGTTLTLTWRAAGSSADHYIVFVTTPDGRRQLFVQRARRLVLRGVPSKGRIQVTVSGVNALGVRGVSARARA